MARTPSTMVPLGTAAPPFALPDTRTGATVSLDDVADADALLVAFLCNHCPFVKHVQAGFADFAREYAERGLAVVGISSNDAEAYPQDGPERMKEEAEAAGYVFPYLYDESQEVARAYGAACTPDFFLFDRERRLAYRGQMDDSRPSNGVPVTGKDLRRAADAVLGGRSPDGEQVPSIGCNIKWKPGNAPEWHGGGG